MFVTIKIAVPWHILKTMTTPGKVVGAWRIGVINVIVLNVRRNIKTSVAKAKNRNRRKSN